MSKIVIPERKLVTPQIKTIIPDPSTTPWLPKLGCDPPEHPFNKQWKVFNTRKRIVLVSGSRKSGKTHAVLHRIVRHLWETPGAQVGVFAKSIKLAKEAGSWQTLVTRIIGEWIEGNMVNREGKPFEYATFDSEGYPGPKQDAQTRTSYFRVRNYWGGESECRLFSIDNDNEIASKVKSKEFSMVYFIELSMFRDGRILPFTLSQLRMPHLRPPPGQEDTNHMWIADTNPDEDLGDQSWFYKEFYVRRMQDLMLIKDPEQRRKEEIYLRSLEVIELFMQDNPFLTENEKIENEMSCKGDPAMYDSHVLGIHGQAGRKRTKFFAPLFARNLHVVGENEGEGDQIDVSTSSTTLYGGWDLGSSVNHAAILLDKRIVNVGGKELSYWSVLDELVSINEQIGLEEFTQQMMEKIKAIEARSKRRFEWMHWSDDSAINVYRPTSESFDYLEVMAHSKGQIRLVGVEKPAGSVKARVRWLQNLLKCNRIYISSRCVKVIEMIQECQRGYGARLLREGLEEISSDVVANVKEYVKWDEHKHVFDALTYPIYMECRGELFDEASDRPNATSEIASIG